MEQIKFKYIIKRLDNVIFNECFTLEEIESGVFSNWFVNNNIGKMDKIYKCRFIGVSSYGEDLYEGDIVDVVFYGIKTTHVIEYCVASYCPAFDIFPRLEDIDGVNGLQYCFINSDVTIKRVGDRFNNAELLIG